MYCTRCGIELQESDRFCSKCGTPTVNAEMPLVQPGQPRPLTRLMVNKKIAGVCAGVARYMGLDVTLVRLVWFLLIFAPVPAILAYIVCWIVLPAEYEVVAKPGFDPIAV